MSSLPPPFWRCDVCHQVFRGSRQHHLTLSCIGPLGDLLNDIAQHRVVLEASPPTTRSPPTQPPPHPTTQRQPTSLEDPPPVFAAEAVVNRPVYSGHHHPQPPPSASPVAQPSHFRQFGLDFYLDYGMNNLATKEEVARLSWADVLRENRLAIIPRDLISIKDEWYKKDPASRSKPWNDLNKVERTEWKRNHIRCSVFDTAHRNKVTLREHESADERAHALVKKVGQLEKECNYFIHLKLKDEIVAWYNRVTENAATSDGITQPVSFSVLQDAVKFGNAALLNKLIVLYRSLGRADKIKNKIERECMLAFGLKYDQNRLSRCKGCILRLIPAQLGILKKGLPQRGSRMVSAMASQSTNPPPNGNDLPRPDAVQHAAVVGTTTQRMLAATPSLETLLCIQCFRRDRLHICENSTYPSFACSVACHCTPNMHFYGCCLCPAPTRTFTELRRLTEHLKRSHGLQRASKNVKRKSSTTGPSSSRAPSRWGADRALP